VAPNVRRIASGSGDGSINIWCAETGELLRSFASNAQIVYGISWSPNGKLIAYTSASSTIKIISSDTGKLRRKISGPTDWSYAVAWSPDGRTLLAGGKDAVIRLWNARTGELLMQSQPTVISIYSLAWSPDCTAFASGGDDGLLRLWDLDGKVVRTLEGHKRGILSIAWSPDGGQIATGGMDSTIRLWHPHNGRQISTLEGHTARVNSVSYSSDGQLIASKGQDSSVRLWRSDSGTATAILHEPSSSWWASSQAFHPFRPVLATLGVNDTVIRIWNLDISKLLISTSSGANHVLYTTAKIVLVGDSGVGKTGLGWRLAHGTFREHPSSHGQQFWVLDNMSSRRKDGTECEAVLWDLAGQPDYRLIHALFLDDADLALILFNPTDRQDPLHGVDFWLKALSQSHGRPCATILVGARLDRGAPTLTLQEIDTFCHSRGIPGGYIGTSALTGFGLDELAVKMTEQITWDDMTATVTTSTFKRIKEYVLSFKEESDLEEVISSPVDLRNSLQALDKEWKFTDVEIMTAIGHLSNYGYLRVLRTSSGEQTILLRPELLNNLAASFVLEARRNQKGLGSIDEGRVLSGDLDFPEVAGLNASTTSTLLDAAIVLFVEHHICFRETLGQTTFLIFPELINQRKPYIEDVSVEDDVSYIAIGSIENIYASLVVLLGYTNTFTRSNQWYNQAQYEVAKGRICGFRQVVQSEGVVEFIIYYSQNLEKSARNLFQALFEQFLFSRNVEVTRYPPLSCSKCGYRQERTEVVRRTQQGQGSLFCSNCGKKIAIPTQDLQVTLKKEHRREATQQGALAQQRTVFESALVKLLAFVRDQMKDTKTPECFISYAWGEPRHETWVEKVFARDLKNAGIRVVLDRWDNSEIGSNVSRFISLIENCDTIIVVGTPAYRKKYENQDKTTGSIVAAEVDLINLRLIGAESGKKSVRPLLLEGEEDKSFPPLLRGKVYADFRSEMDYLPNVCDMVSSIYNIPFTSVAIEESRDALRRIFL
jgi:WD40 repeat protein